MKPYFTGYRIVQWTLAAVASIVAFAASASTIVTREIDSPTLHRKWSYDIYLPTGYDQSQLKYPVLYLLHGNGGNLHNWNKLGHIQQTTDSLIAAGDIPATIIVMPDAGTTWYVDRKESMESAILHDLIPDVEKQFKTLTSRDGRLIGGLSMGGYGSMRFALKYPEMFAAAALLSPAIYAPEPPMNSSARRVGVFGSPDYDPNVWKSLSYPSLWDGYLAKKTPVPMYIVSGDDDDFHIESSATQFYELLRDNHQPAELRIVDGAHRWPVWAATIGDGMKYIYRFSARPVLVGK